jgi:hypothetical protein
MERQMTQISMIDSPPEGRTFNIRSSETAADGTKTWKTIGRVFVRADGSGGTVYVGDGPAQRRYVILPHDPKRRRVPKSDRFEKKDPRELYR